jgi:hypothetical protein
MSPSASGRKRAAASGESTKQWLDKKPHEFGFQIFYFFKRPSSDNVSDDAVKYPQSSFLPSTIPASF